MQRIALVQVHVQNNKDKAVEHALKLLRKVGLSDSDIVCLPELWYSRIVTNFETEFDKIIDIAKEYSMVIIPGAFIERNNSNNNKNGNDLQISSPVIANDGMILGRQLKIHPFGSQRKVVKAGTKVDLFETRNIKFGIGICYDIVFPEVARALVKKGADILFFPSKIRYEGIKPWHMYVQVRALENRIPIAAPNVCGDNSSNNNSIYKGKSIFVDFDYDYKTDIAIPKIRFGSSVNEQILIMDIDVKRNRKLRKKRFEDFRNNLYGLF
ncbi:MAG: carbon-nitrogen hydrolase family protein [Nitrososphaeraceae archaeon]|nr:carbon-nitrogen hydrolase family protein [Nitrososphaeraceae archaeon]MBV9669308.1 carbon-nitrogen hydrolase family protein [Nitrososphaeraceae archaeon]